jgi:hypothetical protein
MSDKKRKVENSVADLIKPKKNIYMRAIVFVVKVQKLIPVPKKVIPKKPVCGNQKIPEKIKKIQL